ncbi:MAG TPA: hypothetical protein VKE74_12235, partial [Gemmataceae bacterium]|nr:hypothetical protein [Gemmataceae bacterium]
DLVGGLLSDLGGEVSASLALATYGPDRVLYVYEMGEKKETVVSLIPRNGKQVHWRWPDAAGRPVVAGWVDAEKAVVASDRGAAIWFDYAEDRFAPQGVAMAPGDKGRHAVNDLAQWYLIPGADPKKCDLCQLGPLGPAEPLGGGKEPAIPTWRIDAKGLSK